MTNDQTKRLPTPTLGEVREAFVTNNVNSEYSAEENLQRFEQFLSSSADNSTERTEYPVTLYDGTTFYAKSRDQQETLACATILVQTADNLMEEKNRRKTRRFAFWK